MELKAAEPKPMKLKAVEQKPIKLNAEPVLTRKVTLRKFLGVSKEEALKMAKQYMSMATKLMEDTDEE